LYEQLGIAFMYSESFHDEVSRVVEEEANYYYDGGCNDDRPQNSGDNVTKSIYDTMTNHENNFYVSSRKGLSRSNNHHNSVRPKQHHFDLILEYLDLLEEEGINHDVSDCYEAAYDIGVFLGRHDYIENFDIINKCLTLYEISKGPNHKVTKRFRTKIQKNKR
jgi:hypothetical protein